MNERGGWERTDTCICMAESLCCPPETTTILLTILQYKIKSLKKKRKKEKFPLVLMLSTNNFIINKL